MFPASSASRRGRWTALGIGPGEGRPDGGPEFGPPEGEGRIPSAEAPAQRSPQAGRRESLERRSPAGRSGDYGVFALPSPAHLE